MVEANLSGACLKEANLCKANFIDAILRDADLSRANISEAILTSADLSGVNLSGTVFEEFCLSDILSLDGAIMPDGQKFDPAIHTFWKGPQVYLGTEIGEEKFFSPKVNNQHPEA